MSDEKATTLRISLPSELGYEKVVRKMIAWLLPGFGFDKTCVANMETAISEACINAIEHGNQGRPELRVQVTLAVAPDHVDALVADEGVKGYQPSTSALPTMEEKLAGLAPARGMGLMLIGHLVDEAGFLPAESGSGNRFHLRVYRHRPSA